MLIHLLPAAVAALGEPPRCQAVISAASAYLRVADAALARHEASGALRALDTGLTVLGLRYAAPGMVDDTGMHLVLAEQRERSGALTQAAALKRRILAERMALCGDSVAPQRR